MQSRAGGMRIPDDVVAELGVEAMHVAVPFRYAGGRAGIWAASSLSTSRARVVVPMIVAAESFAELETVVARVPAEVVLHGSGPLGARARNDCIDHLEAVSGMESSS